MITYFKNDKNTLNFLSKLGGVILFLVFLNVLGNVMFPEHYKQLMLMYNLVNIGVFIYLCGWFFLFRKLTKEYVENDSRKEPKVNTVPITFHQLMEYENFKQEGNRKQSMIDSELRLKEHFEKLPNNNKPMFL